MNRGELNKQAAFHNIGLKKEILQSWTASMPRDHSGKLEYFPQTIRQFNAWDLSQNSAPLRNSLPKITKNANDTLRNYPATKAEVQSVIALLKNITKRTCDKSNRLVALKNKIRDLEMYQHALEEELITLRLEFLDWNQRAIASDEKYKSLLSEFHSAEAVARENQARLTAQNAELTKSMSKISGLQVKRNATDKNSLD